MEEKNNKRKKLLYPLLAVALLLALVVGTYAFFSASVSNNSIGGSSLNISGDDLSVTVKKVVFNGASASSDNLVPAWFGYSSGTTLNNDDPSSYQLTMTPDANSFGHGVFSVNLAGNVIGTTTNDEYGAVRPVIYLKTGVTIDTDGKDGSAEYPYELSLS